MERETEKRAQVCVWVCFASTLVICLVSKVERDLLVGKLGVDIGKSVELALHMGLVLVVQHDLHDPLSIRLDPCPLAKDFCGVHNVIQNGVLYSREGARARTRTVGLLVPGVRLAKDGSLSNDNDVTSRELLLQLTDQTDLDLVEGFEQLKGNVDDDGLAAAPAVNLLGSRDVEVAKGGLELRGVHLQVQQLLGHRGFEFIRCCLWGGGVVE